MADRRDDAQKQFAKLQRAEDGKKAMAEYEADAAAMRAKTARLRALRLARDAEPAATAPEAPAKKKKARRRPRGQDGQGAKGTLSDWLDEARQRHKN